jgi:hypothetical protein
LSRPSLPSLVPRQMAGTSPAMTVNEWSRHH